MTADAPDADEPTRTVHNDVDAKSVSHTNVERALVLDEVSTAASKHIHLASTSRSADAGHLSAADIVTIAGDAGIDFRLVGGNAISLLVWVHEELIWSLIGRRMTRTSECPRKPLAPPRWSRR